MGITLIQALIITLFSIFSNLMFPLLGDIGGYFGIGRPMIAGTIVGIVLGDVKTGMLIGATLNAVYMNSQAVGNVMSTDVTMAGYTATTLAMAGSNDTSVALSHTNVMNTLPRGISKRSGWLESGFRFSFSMESVLSQRFRSSTMVPGTARQWNP